MTSTLTLSDDTKHAVQIAQSLAKEYQNAQFTPGHLLHALLHKDIGLRALLESLGQDVPYLQEWAEVRIENLSKNTQIPEEPTGDDKVTTTIEEADLIRLKLNEDKITPLSVLTALCKPNVAFTRDQLKTFPLQADALLATVVAEEAIQEAIAPSSTNGSPKPGAAKPKALFKYCVDKTSLAREGKTDPIIGRDRETRMMVEILGRRTKPNVLIVGEPGVGKTALVDGFALDIVNGKVPQHLAAAVLFELDLGALVAGASYKGEVEDRLKNIIKEVKTFDKAVLFIDELHLLLDPKGPVGSGAANLLKPELARGEITVIGATTLEEYRKFIEKEEAFNRRFEVLRVDEPDLVVAERMVKTLVNLYEQHHTITVASDAPKEAVLLAQRYIKDRRLPDSAIDLLDRTMAAIRMADETSAAELTLLRERLDVLRQESDLKLEDLHWYQRELHNKISPILLSQLPEALIQATPDTIDALTEHLEKTIEHLVSLTDTKKGSVEKADVAAMVAHKTGIPLGKIQTKEREKLLRMDEHLRQRVVGQDHATKVIADAVLESRSGLIKQGQPIGSFFFLGPTGTGKTELAKSLAEFLFNDESTLLRFDMSEFKEEHSAAVLLGAPAGYVGYEEGGVLVNKIREKPYAVVLFDEIEKAHSSVFDIFLQIMDEGKLHDRLGKEGDFSNAVILFTSNIGSKHVMDTFATGKLPSSQEMMEVMSRHFRPEFLARVTEIVPFAPIQEENVVKIFDIHLRKLLKQLDKQGITLEISDAAKQDLALSGYTPEYGARPLTGVIRNQLRRPISRLVIGEEVGKGSVIALDVDENKELVWKY